METSTNSTVPPHLSSQTMSSLYPATPDSFSAYATPEPILTIQLTKLKKKSITLVWILLLVALIGGAYGAFVQSQLLLEGSAILFILGIILAFFLTTGRTPSGQVPQTNQPWYFYINTPTTYSAILAFSSGVYLRKTSSDDNFTFLPWSMITAVELDKTNAGNHIVFSTTTDVVTVLLDGELLNAFTQDTPLKVAQALQEMLTTVHENPSSIASMSPQQIKERSKMAYLSFGLIVALIVIMLAYYLYTIL